MRGVQGPATSKQKLGPCKHYPLFPWLPVPRARLINCRDHTHGRRPGVPARKEQLQGYAPAALGKSPFSPILDLCAHASLEIARSVIESNNTRMSACH